MREILIATADRIRVTDTVNLVRAVSRELPRDAQMVLVIELTRLLQPAINALKREAEKTKTQS